MEMMRLVSTGTEATMHAIRTARGYTGRKKIVKFEGCFHGSTRQRPFKAGSGATTFGPPTWLGIPRGNHAEHHCFALQRQSALRSRIHRAYGNEIAAVIFEPVIGNVGLILPEKDYLRLSPQNHKRIRYGS